MSRDGAPRFEFHVFDYAADPSKPYLERVGDLDMQILGLQMESDRHDWLRPLVPSPIRSVEELVRYEEWCLDEGYEGVMIRSACGPYKFGRSTAREGYLLKLKRFEDAEAVVIGTEELLRNGNEQERDALGHAKRSKAKAGMVPGGTLGKLLVRRADGVEFAIGSGFTAAQRAELWARRDALAGALVKFKHQPHGAQEAPRLPIFLGLRHGDDT
jgi:DNA ligase-1